MRRILCAHASFLVLASAASSAVADIYDAPPTYYNTATSTSGPTLKAQLNDIIDGHTLRGYSTTAGDNALLKLEEDPNNTSNVLLVYSGVSIAKSLVLNTSYNREHLWCDSYGLDGTNRAYSDLFNLRIADAGVNSDRGNEFYQDVPVANQMAANTDAPGCFENNLYPDTDPSGDQMWEPRTVEKGDIARSLFYMDTRYSGDADDDFPRDLTLVGTSQLNTINGSNNNMGNLDSLLKWHYQDPVSTAERRRNHLIYTSDTGVNGWNGTAYNQGNRNPFIDHPEYVWAIFGGGNNNSKLYVGGSAPSDGASTTTVTNRIMKGRPMPTNNVTLNKSGTNPTTFDVTVGGEATSTAAGINNAFDYNAQTRTIPVTLSSSTAVTGLKTGTVTVNNTDITSGGTGMGSADGNDVITMNVQVIDNRTVSGSAVAFGSVIVGGTTTQNTTLSTTGDDNNFTRITVRALAVSADSNGVSATAGAGDVLFNGAGVTTSRTLSGTFSSTGSKVGSVSFSKLGEGLIGEVDNNVLAGYSATVLSHSNASFASPADVNTATPVDFGYVPNGATARTSAFAINNLVTTVGFTAGLALTNISGDTSALTTNASTFTNLAAGSANNYLLTLGTSTVGAFSTTHTFTVADQALPGATTNTALTLASQGRVFNTTAASFPVTGFMFIPATEPLVIGTSSIGSGATLTKTGLGSVTINNTQSNGTNSQLIVNGGDFTMNSDAGTAAVANLQYTANATAGTTTFGATQHLASLALNSATANVSAGGNKVVVVNTISTSGSGKLDLADNDLIVRNMTRSAVETLVKAGFGNSDWQGTGITSSNAASFAQIDVSRMLGVLDNADFGYTQFDGEDVVSTDVLVKYTYTGDATLDGVVDPDDFNQFVFGFNGGPATWLNGDFDYNNVVDPDDFNAFIAGMNAYNASGQTPLSESFKSELADFATANGIPLVLDPAPLPEPAALSFLGAAAMLLGRRRRSR